MAIIDTSAFNFSPEEIRDINELIFEEILDTPELSALSVIYPNIRAQKYIGFLGEGAPVGLPAQGCDPTPQEWTIPGEQKMWDPHRWEVFLTECWADYENTLGLYALNKGVDVGDLTNTDIMAVIVEILSKAIKKMLWRIAWFGDLDAANYNGSPAGVITNGVNVDLFKIINGFWKQLQAIAPVGSTQRVVIPANAAATMADQYTQLTGQMAHDTLSAMHLQASVVLRGQTGLQFAVTQSIADAYMQYLEGKEQESLLVNLTDGRKVFSFRGYPVVPYPIWDEMIQQFENSGTKLNNPHRALFTVKENLAIGVEAQSALTDVAVWYEPKDDRTYMRARDKMDALVLNDKMFTLGI